MKKISKLLFLLICSFGFILTADAFSVGENFPFWSSTYGNQGDLWNVDGSQSDYHVNMYYAAGEDSKNYGVLCLDPHKGTPAELNVFRVLMDSEQYYAEDYGILKLLSAYGGNSLQDTATLYEQGLAVRLLADGVYGWTNTSKINVGKVQALQGAARAIVAEGVCSSHDYSKSAFIYTNGKYGSKDFGELGFQYSGSNSDFNNKGLNINSSHRQKVLEYFCTGYNAYMDYKAGKEDSKLPIANGVRSFAKLSEDEKSSYFVIALQVKDLGENFEAGIDSGQIKLTYDGLEYVHKDYSFEVVGLSTKQSNDNFEEHYNIPISEGQNLLQIPDVKNAIVEGNGTATFYVSVLYKFFGDENAEKGIAHFKYTFNHPKALHGALLKADHGGFDISAFQRFISFGYDGQNKYVELNPEFTGCPPALIPQVCADGLEKENIYHPEDGTVTFTFIESAKEGETSNRIDKCILEHEDVYANSYRLLDNENAALVSGNPYCQMYCKEDFVFNLPYQRKTQNGRYFQIRTSIAGKQLCYSTKIDENAFMDDLNAAQKNLVDYYNEYHYYDLLLTTPLEESTDEKSFKIQTNSCNTNQSDYCCTSSISCCPTPAEGEEAPTSPCCCSSSGTKGEATSLNEEYIRYKVIRLADTFYTYEEIPDAHKLNIYGNKSFKETAIYSQYGGSGSGGSGGATPVALTKSDTYTLYQLGLEKAIQENYTVVQLGGVVKKPVIKTIAISLDTEGYDSSDDSMYFGGDKHDGKQCYAYYETDTCGDGECELKIVGDCSATLTTSTYEFKDGSEDYEAHKAEWESARSAAKSKMEGAQATILQLIDLYNACTGNDFPSISGAYGKLDWKIAYNFNPKISYEYYEPDTKEYKLDGEPYKWIKEVQNIQCGNTSCDVMVTAGIELHSEVFNNKVSENAVYEWKDTASETMYDLNYEDATEWDTSKTLNAKTYCFDDKVDPNTHECANPKSSYNGEVKAITVYEFDGASSFVQKSYNISTVTYINTASTARATYDTQRVYYSGTPQGQIKISNKKPEGEYSQVDGLPVSILTPAGMHYYKIKFDNIGTYYSTGNLGRIYGNNINSLSNYNGSTTLPQGDGSLPDEQTKVLQNEYACSYKIGDDIEDTPENVCVETAEHGYCVCSSSEYDDSCDCKGTSPEAREQALTQVGCTPNETCEYNYNCCPYCEIVCIGQCVFESKDWPEYSGDSLLSFRPVNESDINPNERDMGMNWDSQNYGNDVNWGQTVPNVLVAQKAGVTIDEIESRANVNIATIGDGNKLDDINAPEMVVKLSPKMINYVKDYNKSQESKGSYNNDTLDCYDYQVEYTDKDVCLENGFIWEPNDDVPDPYNPYNESGTCVLKSIFCYSSFIDDLQQNFNTNAENQQVIIKGNRRKASVKYDASIPKFSMAGEISKPYLNGNKYNLSGGYEVEVQNIDDYWAVFYYNKLDVNGDHVADIGPSWK